MIELKFPAHFSVDHLAYPVLSRLILLCLLHSLIMWLIVSSLSPHSLHYYYYYYYYYYFTSWEFFISVLADGFSLDFEWQQISRTLLSIRADPNDAVLWTVSTRPLISKSHHHHHVAPPAWISLTLSRHLEYYPISLVTVQRVPIRIGIIVTFMFRSFSMTYQGLVTSSFCIHLVLLCGLPGQQRVQIC